jgi:hypothetical protein
MTRVEWSGLDESLHEAEGGVGYFPPAAVDDQRVATVGDFDDLRHGQRAVEEPALPVRIH